MNDFFKNEIWKDLPIAYGFAIVAGCFLIIQIFLVMSMGALDTLFVVDHSRIPYGGLSLGLNVSYILTILLLINMPILQITGIVLKWREDKTAAEGSETG
jgi:hypothetical protein